MKIRVRVREKPHVTAGARVPANRPTGRDGPNGLREKMLAIEEAAASPYGALSPRHQQIKGIKV